MEKFCIWNYFWNFLIILLRRNPNENIGANLSESWTTLCIALCENQNLCRVRHKLFCLTSKYWKSQYLNFSYIKISEESDINYSEQNCQCWTCHLTLQSQTDSDTDFFIMEYCFSRIFLNDYFTLTRWHADIQLKNLVKSSVGCFF